MTRLLVSVTNAAEAVAALSAGAAVIDAKNPAAGALGALDLASVTAIVAAVGGAVEVSAAIGDEPTLSVGIAFADAGVGTVKTPVPEGAKGRSWLAEIGAALAARSKLVAVFAADRAPAADDLAAAAEAGFSGVMLDTVDKDRGLLDVIKLPEIAHFITAARRAGLGVGLAGSLKVIDVGTLLPLQPDLLGFRGGVCEGGDRTKPLDPARVRAVAAALKVHAARRAAGA